ncbi:MAG: hypothetical protein HC871_01045 [Rhizobiales bacterium]|nr:hypothetical protein [Hyphomicrobiales bacterium]
MFKPRWLPLLLLPVIAGCAQQGLHPVEPAVQSNLRGHDARVAEAGVQVAASTGAWNGIPQNLERAMTPVLFRIDNRSDRPLMIDYDAFRMAGASGKVYAALPPFSIDDAEVAPVAGQYPHYPHTGFSVAPYLERYYDGLGPYGTATFDPAYYDRYYPHWRSGAYVDLPTDDMLSRALPEGIVSPGGKAGGFVYFEDMADVEPVDVTMTLKDAASGEPFGSISIPFVPEEPSDGN